MNRQKKQCPEVEDPARDASVTRKMLRTRAFELAMLDSRFRWEIWRSDWEQAKRDLMGEGAEVDLMRQASLQPD